MMCGELGEMGPENPLWNQTEYEALKSASYEVEMPNIEIYYGVMVKKSIRAKGIKNTTPKFEQSINSVLPALQNTGGLLSRM